MGSLWSIFETRHHSNGYIFGFWNLYVGLHIKCTALQTYIWWHRVNDTILMFEFCTSPRYNNLLQSWHSQISTPCQSHFILGRGCLASCISNGAFTWVKPTREKYPNHLKCHNFNNLVLIVEAKKTIWRNSGVSIVYTFWHEDFDGVELCAARQYMHLTRNGIEEELFVN